MDSDTTPPVLTVSSTPRVLWSPNHKLVEIAITLEATDDSDLVAFRAFLDELGYPYASEHENPAYRFFLG